MTKEFIVTDQIAGETVEALIVVDTDLTTHDKFFIHAAKRNGSPFYWRPYAYQLIAVFIQEHGKEYNAILLENQKD